MRLTIFYVNKSNEKNTNVLVLFHGLFNTHLVP